MGAYGRSRRRKVKKRNLEVKKLYLVRYPGMPLPSFFYSQKKSARKAIAKCKRKMRVEEVGG